MTHGTAIWKKQRENSVHSKLKGAKGHSNYRGNPDFWNLQGKQKMVGQSRVFKSVQEWEGAGNDFGFELLEGLKKSRVWNSLKDYSFLPKCGEGLTRGYSQKNWVGVCGPLPKTLTLFMTKTCKIPYPIYDLTLKSKPSSDQTVNINVKGFCWLYFR